MPINFSITTDLSLGGLLTLSGQQLAASGTNRLRFGGDQLLTKADSGALVSQIVDAAGVLSLNGMTGGVTLASAPGNAGYVGISNSGTTIYASGSSNPVLSGITFPGGNTITGDSTNLFLTAGTVYLGGGSPAIYALQNADFSIGRLGAGARMTIKASNGDVLVGTSTDALNGILQLATHTTSGGGLGLGPDNSIWRTAANQVTYNGTLNLTGLVLPGGARVSGAGGSVFLTTVGTGGFTQTPALAVNDSNPGAYTMQVRVGTNQRLGVRSNSSRLQLLGFNDADSAYSLIDIDASILRLNAQSNGDVIVGGNGVLFLGTTGSYIASGAASIAQLLKVSGDLSAAVGATSTIVYTTGNQTITGAKGFGGSTNTTSSVTIKDTGYRGGLNFERQATTVQRAHLYIGNGTNGTVTDELYWDLNNTALHLRAGTVGTGEFLTTTPAGYVGFGTASPSFFHDVTGQTRIGRGTPSAGYGLNVVDATYGNIIWGDGTRLGQASYSPGGGGSVNFGSVSNHDFQITTNGTTKATLAVGGFLGLGTITPTHAFQIEGDASNATTGWRYAAQVIKNNSASTSWGPNLRFQSAEPGTAEVVLGMAGGRDAAANAGLSGGSFFLYNGAGIQMVMTSGTSSRFGLGVLNPSGHLQVTGTTLLATNGGNVGIGTASPAQLLEIAKATGAIFQTRATADYSSNQTAGNGITYGELRFQHGVSTPTYAYGPGVAARFNAADASFGRVAGLDFIVSNVGSVTGMSILGIGNVGVGTTAPAEKLHVSGGSVQINATSNQLKVRDTSALLGFDLGYDTSYFRLKTSAGDTALVANWSTLNVGIGAAVPATKLHVSGTANTYMAIDAPDASERGIEWRKAGVQKWLLYMNNGDANDKLDFYSYEGGGTKMTLQENGSVGIGTESPAERLHISGGNLRVDGSGIFGGAAAVNLLTLRVPTIVAASASIGVKQAQTSDGIAAQAQSNDAWVRMYHDGSVAYIDSAYQSTAGYKPIGFNVSNAEAMRLTAAGRLGLGTTNPAYHFECTGSFGALTKSFTIPHTDPVKGASGWKLVHGVIEGDAHRVYQDGLAHSGVIPLPSYWATLVRPDSIKVQLTPAGRGQSLYVESVDNTCLRVVNEGTGAFAFYYNVVGTRADVPQFEVEVAPRGGAGEGA